MPTRQQAKKMKQNAAAVKENTIDDFNDEDLAGILDDDTPPPNTKQEYEPSKQFNQKCIAQNVVEKIGRESVYSDEQEQSQFEANEEDMGALTNLLGELEDQKDNSQDCVNLEKDI